MSSELQLLAAAVGVGARVAGLLGHAARLGVPPGRGLRLQGRAREHTGPSVVLATMIPTFGARMHPDGSASFLLRQIQWLLLVVIRPGADIPLNTLLRDLIIDVGRLGAAFDMLVANRLDTSPCSPSVARARIKALGMRLAVGDPIPFTAMMVDLYVTLADTHGAATHPAGPCSACVGFRCARWHLSPVG